MENKGGNRHKPYSEMYRSKLKKQVNKSPEWFEVYIKTGYQLN